MVDRMDAHEAAAMIGRGATVVDPLPSSVFMHEHLPGAVSLPLDTLVPAAVERWDRSAPIVVYGSDQHCDVGSRTAHRLERLGFTGVSVLTGGRAAWTVLGFATDGQVGDRRRVSQFVTQPITVTIDATVGDVIAQGTWDRPAAVLGDRRVLLGALHPSAADLPAGTRVEGAMTSAPGTIRPDVRIDDALAQLAKDHLDHVLVTTVSGELVGMLVADHAHV